MSLQTDFEMETEGENKMERKHAVGFAVLEIAYWCFHAAFGGFISAYLLEHGMTSSALSLISAAYLLCSFAGSFVFGGLCDRLQTNRKVFIAGVFLTAALACGIFFGVGSVPAIAFNHVPLPEYDELWMFDGTVGGRWEKTWRPTLNSGLFALMYRLGDFRGIFAGHDHTNSFHGYMYGIMLAYGRAGGYQIACEDYYKRGGRVIVLGEKSGQIDDTYIVLHDGSRDEPVVSPPVFDRNCFYDCAFVNGIPVTEAHRKLPEKDLSLWKLPFPSAE